MRRLPGFRAQLRARFWFLPLRGHRAFRNHAMLEAWPDNIPLVRSYESRGSPAKDEKRVKVIEFKREDLPVKLRLNLPTEAKEYLLLLTKQDKLLLNKPSEKPENTSR